jgi:uncharacterized membrane protein YjjP (DUF1212 family)
MERHSPAAVVDPPTPLEAGELALQLGGLLLQSGASTSRVVKVMREVLAVLGLPGAGAVVTPELMTVVAGDGSLPHPVVCVTPRISWNINRLAGLEQLVGEVLQGAGDHRQLREELERLRALPSPYRRWLYVAASAGVGASLSRLLAADWAGTAVAALACAAGQSVRGGIAGRFNLGLRTLITAVVAAVIGSLGVRLHLSQTPMATLTASVSLLVPGLWLITGGLDVLGGRQIRFGLLRLTVASLLFAAIALGVGLAQAIVW